MREISKVPEPAAVHHDTALSLPVAALFTPDCVRCESHCDRLLRIVYVAAPNVCDVRKSACLCDQVEQFYRECDSRNSRTSGSGVGAEVLGTILKIAGWNGRP